MTAPADPTLLADLAAAPCGSRELDCRIHVAVHKWKLTRLGPDAKGQNASEFYTPHGRLVEGFGYPVLGGIGLYYHVPADAAYSTSLDAALTLVPDGMWWSAGKRPMLSDDVTYGAEIMLPRDVPDGHRLATGKGCTPALALVQAALRARGAA